MNDVNRMNRKVLEELKAMGRMDGDGVTSDTGYEVAVEWRKECEQLQGRIAELEAQLKTSRQCVAERDEIIERIEVEFERLREENERLRSIPISPGTIREIEALHIIIKHMAPLI